MADDLHAIRCGLAAQLRTAMSASQGHVSPYFDVQPPTPILQVGTIESAERLGYGADGGSRYVLLIEGLFSLEAEVLAQKQLDELVSSQAVSDAIDADRRLTSRLDEDNVLTEDEDPACDAADVIEYRGSARVPLPDGRRVLQGVWAVQVVT
jgi:hypothetical protein